MEKDNLKIELPKLKDEELFETKDLGEGIVVDVVSDTYEIKPKKTKVMIAVLIPVLLLIVLIIVFLCRGVVLEKTNKVSILNIEVVNYIKGADSVDIAIIPSSKQGYCSVTDKESDDNLDFQKIVNDKCYVTVPLNQQYVYFKNSEGIVSESLLVNDYVVDLEMEDKYYLTLSTEKPLYNELVVVGNPDIVWMTELDNVIAINEDKFITSAVGSTTLKAMVNNQVIGETSVVVTDVIVNMPERFDEKKEFLSCEVFTSAEAALLDEILAYRIEEAGYGTRAGAVAAARFLTLEFPYRISYYWESGRLNNTGRHYVDGEGRYYHKGLYLDSSKYESIEASLFGPAMWGCKLMSYEDDPPNFVPGVKYPNGLDCSGFVTWALFNGGFDVGDRGAGESPSEGQLTDLGDFRVLTDELIKSGKIKVGDLFNFWGHISILIGQDENNYYIAESLNNYKGVVVKTYSKKNVNEMFKYVVLMDDVYNGDGNLTDMWY